jgi:hypothetical protein
MLAGHVDNAMQCQNLATNAQKNVFGLQYGGECWADTNVAYDSLGSKQGCDPLGSANSNQVYTSPGFVKPSSAPPPPSGSTLTSPGTLTSTGQMLTSPSGKYKAVMQTDGNFVVYNGANKVIWALNIGPRVQYIAGSTAVIQNDGNFVFYGPGGSVVWATNTRGTAYPYKLIMQDDGNLVIYDSNNRATWATGTNGQ